MTDLIPDAPVWHWITSTIVLTIFCLSYYVQCIRRKRKLDFYHGYVFIKIVFPFFIASLFAYDWRNENTVGGAFDGIIAYMPEAFSITAVGSVVVILSSNKLADSLFSRNNSFIRANAKMMRSVLAPKATVTFGVVSAILILGTELVLVLAYGASPFDIRGTSLTEGGIRPLFNLSVVSIGPLALTASGIAWLRSRRLVFFILFGAIALLEALSGSRGSLIEPMAIIGLLYIESKKGRIQTGLIAVVLAALLVGGLALGEIRGRLIHPTEDPAAVSSTDDALYGNNFSDVRDFAWILSRWDRQKLHGRSYAAALMAFVPRTLVPYREEYTISTYCNRFLGFDEDRHAGLRPGLFGEAYLNFGWVGVLIASLFYGTVLGQVRFKIERRRDGGYCDVGDLMSETGPLQLSERVMITAGFWGYYVFILTSLFCRVISGLSSRNSRHLNTSKGMSAMPSQSRARILARR